MDISTKDLNLLQIQAKDLVKQMPQLRKNLRLPLVVEFAGSPKAGKSTTIDIVTHFFKRIRVQHEASIGFKIWAPTEGASKRTPYSLRRDLVAFNAWALNYAISEILTARYNVEEYDLVVLDRGLFDSLAWMRVLKEDGKLTEEEYSRIEKFARHPKWANLVERIYLFTCSPETSMNREHDAKLIWSEGTAMNKEMLGKLQEQYESLRREASEEASGDPLSIKTFSTDKDGGPRNNAYEIVKDIMGLLQSKAAQPG